MTKRVGGLLNHGFDGCVATRVGHDRHDASSAGFGQLGAGLRQRVGRARHQRDVHALGGKLTRDGLADTSASACDDGGLAG